ADEIDPDPQQQIDILKECGIRHIELRSILKTNVLDLTDLQVSELKALLDKNGFRLSAIGSPIGKTKIDEPFGPQLERFKRAIHLCKVFNTPNIRIFSYYLSEGGDWDDWRREVLDRMWQKCALAARANVRLVHENEHRIYGDSPERVRDLMETVREQLATPNTFGAVYDPANYVFCGYDPWQGWQMTKDFTVHFHIKDWVKGEEHGRPAGDGHGRVAEVMADAVKRKYEGFATLEPHLLGGGPTGGVTGPELFPKAAAAFKKVLDKAGAAYQ
ncbi:MAG TPA: sugar phosphate isomerase/epimerase family protein, partial [Gemmataceae bacterium]|nr:sugar phosphate isomerase/epimerase family protein [Gemmataceae bacterium]